MKVAVIIPARYGSTRLEGKPLMDIMGKPMVVRVYEACIKAQGVDEVFVATDDERIYRAVVEGGGKALMTSSEHSTGTDRVREASEKIECDVVINVQGDEPLVKTSMIEAAIEPFKDNNIMMTTLKTPILHESEVDNPNTVKVVTDKEGFALYFSRAPIPFNRDDDGGDSSATKYFKHIGLYGYRKDFLKTFADLKPTPLEETEKLEQLRALENGYKIMVRECDFNAISVDTIEDLELVRSVFKRDA